MAIKTPGPNSHVYVISVAAELSGLHPQTLRTYERQGLVHPGRTGGGGRRYSANDIDRLRQISDLTAAGIGIEGVKRILELEHQVVALQQRNAELVAEVERTRVILRRTRAIKTEAAPPNKLPVLRNAGSVLRWNQS